MKKRYSLTAGILTAVIFISLLLIGALSYMFVPERSFSEDENRTLQIFPHHNASQYATSWFERKLSYEFDRYFSDQFFARQALIDLHSKCEIALGKGECNGVLLGKNGQLAPHLFNAYLSPLKRAENSDVFSIEHIQNQSNALITLADRLAEQNIPLYFLPAPRTVDVCASAFPYPKEKSDKLNEIISNEYRGNNVILINMLTLLREYFDRGQYVCYRTDHHWTTAGAYLAYCEIMRSMGMEAQLLTRDDFSIRRIENFVGTSASRFGVFKQKSDTLEIWERDDDTNFSIYDGNSKLIMKGFIDENYLSRKDKYGSFLSGTRNILNISENGNAGKPRLLIVKDSFANSVVPFLARHFDLSIVNLSGGMVEVSKYVEKFGCDAVVVIYNRENMICSDYLNRVR